MEYRTTCHICGSDCTPVFTASDERYESTPDMEFEVCECEFCGAGQTVPQPDDMTEYYIPDYYDDLTPSPDRSEGLLSRLSARYEELMDIDRTLGPEPGSVLEVGCGPGHNLHELAVEGWDVVGVEPSEDAVEIAKKEYGLSIHCGTLTEVNDELGGDFDVVLFNHVFEHLPDPAGNIETAKSLLTDGGVIIIEVPNFDSIERHLLGRFWGDHDVPRHLYHYTPNSLDLLMYKRGFERVNESYDKGALLMAAWISNYISSTLDRDVGASLLYPLCIPLGLVSGFARRSRFRHSYRLRSS